MLRRISILAVPFALFMAILPASSVNTSAGNSYTGRRVGQWDRFEETILNRKEYRDPFNDVALDVIYSSPDGRSVRFPGFYDGGSNWKIRFMPDRIGTWKYVARFSDGSAGKSGTFSCVTSSIPGMIGRDELNPGWFGFKGGHHFLMRAFHVGDRFFASNFSDSSRKAFLDWFQRSGYNTISVASHYLNRKSANRGEGWDTPKLWPLNAGEYKRMEAILDDLSRRRIVIYPFAGFIGRDSNAPKGDERSKYIKYTVGRLAPYWNILFNVGGPEPLLAHKPFMTGDEIESVAREIKALDPFNHIVTCHNETGNDIFKSADWPDYASVQGGKTADPDELYEYLEKNRHPSRPLLAMETFWPGNKNMPAYKEEELHKLAIVILMSRSAFVYGDMQGSSSTGFSGSMDLGEKIDVRHEAIRGVMDFFETIPFYRMNPRQDLTSRGYCLAEPGFAYLVYIPTGGTVNVSVTNGPYNVVWVNGANPTEKRRNGKTRDGRGLTPPGADWLLYLTKERSMEA